MIECHIKLEANFSLSKKPFQTFRFKHFNWACQNRLEFVNLGKENKINARVDMDLKAKDVLDLKFKLFPNNYVFFGFYKDPFQFFLFKIKQDILEDPVETSVGLLSVENLEILVGSAEHEMLDTPQYKKRFDKFNRTFGFAKNDLMVPIYHYVMKEIIR